jgi:6,7-dimethyl-8-ribityllumazine synthase
MPGATYALVVARFYEDLAQRLEAGARAVFDAEGAAVEVFDVPGSYELPAAAQYVAATGRFDGIACLGAVIRGETDHYEHVCRAAAQGIQDVCLRTGVPCGFGVLTVDSLEQALARSGGGKRDSGADAAHAVLALAAIRDRLAVG